MFLNKELICICFAGYKGNGENDMGYIIDLKANSINLKEVDTFNLTYKNIEIDINTINILSLANANMNLANLILPFEN